MATAAIHAGVILEGNDSVIIRCNGGTVEIIQHKDDFVIITVSCRADAKGKRAYRIDSSAEPIGDSYDVAMVRKATGTD